MQNTIALNAIVFAWLLVSEASLRLSKSVFANFANLVAHRTGLRKRRLEKKAILSLAAVKEPEHVLLETSASKSASRPDHRESQMATTAQRL